MGQKTEELYIRLSDIREAFENNNAALRVIRQLKKYSADEIQKEDNAEELNATKEVLEYLNSVLGTQYKPTTQKHRVLIRARMREGFTVEDFKTVIDKKAKAWMHDERMQKYLRPETLFGTKFEGYLNELDTYKLIGNKPINRQESTYDRIQRLAREGAFGYDD